MSRFILWLEGRYLSDCSKRYDRLDILMDDNKMRTVVSKSCQEMARNE
jgi:hypothetical protein